MSVLLSTGDDFVLEESASTVLTSPTIEHALDAGDDSVFFGPTYLLDVNGDGRDDLMACEATLPLDCRGRFLYDDRPSEKKKSLCAGHWSYSFGTSDGFTEELRTTGVPQVCFVEDSRTVNYYAGGIGDLNGDGLPDLLVSDYDRPPPDDDGYSHTPKSLHSKRRVLSFDARRAEFTAWDSPSVEAEWTRYPVIADLTGDGALDLVGRYPIPGGGYRDATRVLLRFHRDFANASPIVGRSIYTNNFLNARAFDLPLPQRAADFDRDGRAEVLNFVLSEDTQELEEDESDRIVDQYGQWGWYFRRPPASAQLLSVDALGQPSQRKISSIEDTTFGELLFTNNVTGGPLWYRDIQVGDFNGDGAPDVLNATANIDWRHSSLTLNHRPTYRRVYLNRNTKPSRITRVTNGVARTDLIEYKPMSDPTVYAPSDACRHPELCVNNSSNVVARIVRDNGVDAEGNATTYFYRDARVNVQGYGWLGFASVTTKDRATGEESTSFYRGHERGDLGYPFRGQVSRTVSARTAATSFDANESVRFQGSQVATDVEYFETPWGTFWTAPSATVSRHYESETPHRFDTASPRFPPPAWHLEPSTTIRKSWLYDGVGNVEFEQTSTDVGTSITTSVYRYDQNPYGLLYRREVEHQGLETMLRRGLVDAPIRETTFHQYFADSWLPKTITREPSAKSDASSGKYQERRFEYDRFGNATKVEIVAHNAEGELETRYHVLTYGGDGYFPVRRRNALGHEIEISIHPGLGVLTRHVDENRNSTAIDWDGFARPRTLRRVGGEDVVWEYESNDAGLVMIELHSSGARQKTTFDRVDRVVEHAVFAGTRPLAATSIDTWLQRSILFNRDGTVKEVQRADGLREKFEYDGLQLLRRSDSPVSGVATLRYRVGDVTDIHVAKIVYRTDAAGQVWETRLDRAGRPRFVLEPRVYDFRPKADPQIARPTMTYFFGAAGHLVGTSDSYRNLTTITYDSIGRRTELSDPNTGITSFRYSGFDEIAAEADSLYVKRWYFDLLGRPTSRKVGDHQDVWTYDAADGAGVGRLHTATSADGIKDTYAYDSFGRQRSWTRTDLVGLSPPLSFVYGYSEDGYLEELTYPTQQASTQPYLVRYERDDAGRTHRVRGPDGDLLWSVQSRDVAGRVREELFGNRISNTYEYERGRISEIFAGRFGLRADPLCDIRLPPGIPGPGFPGGPLGPLGGQRATKPSTPIGPTTTRLDPTAMDGLRVTVPDLQEDGLARDRLLGGFGDRDCAPQRVVKERYRSLVFEHDDLGRLESRTDSLSGEVESYTHDAIGRLVSMAVNGETRKGYLYDLIGNIRYATDTGWHQYQTRPNVLTGLSERDREQSDANFEIETDSMGRRVRGLGRAVAYTPDDQPRETSLDGNAVAFRYDHASARAQAVFSGTRPGVTTSFDRYTHEQRGGDAELLQVTVDGRPVAVVRREKSSSAPDVFFLHQGYDSSIEMVTDETGKAVASLSYDPFGKRRGGDSAAGLTRLLASGIRAGFTGHEHDDEVGLINMKGRTFDPFTRQFLTADPLVPDLLATQAFNRFGYVMNNPMNFIDPSGFTPDDAGAPVAGAASFDSASGAVAAIAPRLEGQCTNRGCHMPEMRVQAYGPSAPRPVDRPRISVSDADFSSGRPSEARTPSSSGNRFGVLRGATISAASAPRYFQTYEDRRTGQTRWNPLYAPDASPSEYAHYFTHQILNGVLFLNPFGRAEVAVGSMGGGLIRGGSMAASRGGAKLLGEAGRSAFGKTAFKGLAQNRPLRELTDTQIRAAFKGTPFTPSNHAISRLLNPRTPSVGIGTLSDVAGVLNKGTVSSAGGGLVSITRGGFQAIVNPVTNVIVTFKPL